jgi:hypothetical protein
VEKIARDLAKLDNLALTNDLSSSMLDMPSPTKCTRPFYTFLSLRVQ